MGGKRQGSRQTYLDSVEAAKQLGVTPVTLRHWNQSGELVPNQRSTRGIEYYTPLQLQAFREMQHARIQANLYLHAEDVAKQAGVRITTLRKWERDQTLVPQYVDEAGHRYYTANQLHAFLNQEDAVTDEAGKEVYLSTAQAERFLNVSMPTLRAWVETKQLVPCYVSPKGRWYFRQDRLTAFKDQRAKKYFMTVTEFKKRLNVNQETFAKWVAQEQLVPVWQDGNEPYYEPHQLHTLREKYLSEETLNMEEAARLLGVCSETVKRWVMQAAIQPHHCSLKGRRYYAKSDIETLRQQKGTEEVLLTTTQVAQQLKVSTGTIKAWTKLGRLTAQHTTPKGRHYYAPDYIQSLPKPLYLTGGEAAAYLGVYSDKIREWTATGKLRTSYATPKGRRYYSVQDLDACKAADPTIGLLSAPQAFHYTKMSSYVFRQKRDSGLFKVAYSDQKGHRYYDPKQLDAALNRVSATTGHATSSDQVVPVLTQSDLKQGVATASTTPEVIGYCLFTSEMSSQMMLAQIKTISQYAMRQPQPFQLIVDQGDIGDETRPGYQQLKQRVLHQQDVKEIVMTQPQHLTTSAELEDVFKPALANVKGRVVILASPELVQ